MYFMFVFGITNIHSCCGLSTLISKATTDNSVVMRLEGAGNSVVVRLEGPGNNVVVRLEGPGHQS